MKTLQEIKDCVSATKTRSAWDKGVKATAIDLLDTLEGEYTEEALLNGAESWSAWSYGGGGWIYDADIAEAFCGPSELKKVKNGERHPNSSESWLDVQARAAGQAARLIAKCAK